MKRTLWVLALVLAGCSDSPTSGDEQASRGVCEASTGSVAVTVNSGSPIVFDWDPFCPVAMLLVEEGASDMWGISTDEATWDSPDVANRIEPPVTYGDSSSGASTFQEPRTLASGVTYELILWRVLPAGSTAQCQQRFGDLCLLTVHPFTG